EVISNPTIDALVWDNGYAFVASHNTFRSHSGREYSGVILNRMKYNEAGLVYDQAFFPEDGPKLDAMFGELLDTPEVQKAIWDTLGLRI
ncbi:hypothetical protein HDU93_002801, partial [Gonapodya sp. JEL0774]